MSSNIRSIGTPAEKAQFEKDLAGFRAEQNTMNRKYGLPADFFMAHLTRDHFTLTVAGLTAIETLVNELAYKELQGCREETRVIFEKYFIQLRIESKLSLLDVLSYPKEKIAFVKELSAIRNRYAHSVKNYPLSIWQIAEIVGIEQSKLKSIFEKLALVTLNPWDSAFAEKIISEAVHFNIISVVADLSAFLNSNEERGKILPVRFAYANQMIPLPTARA